MIWEVTRQDDDTFIGRRSLITPEVRGSVFEVVQPGGSFFGIPHEDLKETSYKVVDGKAKQVTVEDTLASIKAIIG